MSISFLIVTLCVIFALLSLPLFPFFRLQKHIKQNRQDLWIDKGPFDLLNLLSGGDIRDSFFGIIKETDENVEEDAELVKWAKLCHEIVKMFPKSFIGQVGYFFILLFFTGMFTKQILVWLG